MQRYAFDFNIFIKNPCKGSYRAFGQLMKFCLPKLSRKPSGDNLKDFEKVRLTDLNACADLKASQLNNNKIEVCDSIFQNSFL